MKQERVSMPMGSAGIIGFSPDTKISGVEIEPKVLITLIVATVAIVLITGIIFG